MVHHHSCPVCDSTAIQPLYNITDHSVSGEAFVVWVCGQCSLRFTQDAPEEDAIGRYYKSENYISHTNTSKGIINRLYLSVRTFTLQLKASLVRKYTKKAVGQLMDVGAGTGAFLHHMQHQAWTVSGFEPDADARRVAHEKYGLNLQASEALYTLPQQHFDAITLWHVLEHIHRLHDYMAVLKKALKQDGKLFIAVPNYQSLDASIYGSAWAAYDVPRHLYHFSPQAMEVLMQRHGLKIVARKPMWFDAFYVSLLSSKYRNGNTNWLGAISSGLRSNLNAVLSKDKCSSLIYVVSHHT